MYKWAIVLACCLVLLLPAAQSSAQTATDTPTNTPTPTDTPTATFTPSNTPTPTPNFYYVSTLPSGQAVAIVYTADGGELFNSALLVVIVVMLAFSLFLKLIERRP